MSNQTLTPPNANTVLPQKSRISKPALAVSVMVHLIVLLTFWKYVLVSGYIKSNAFPTSYDVADAPAEAVEEMPEEPVEPSPTDMPTDSAAESSSASQAPDLIATDSVAPTQSFVVPLATSANAMGDVLNSNGTGTSGSGVGNGTGSGGKGGGPKTVSPFGRAEKTENGVVGYFYDLKQTPDRQPTDTTIESYVTFIQGLVAKWDTSLLTKYYKTKDPLYLEQIHIPIIDAGAAPAAFGVEKEVQPSRWLIHYTGTVVSPESGTFRLVGYADDVLIVAFDKKLVFDGSKDRVMKDWDYGDAWVKLRKGEKIPIDILLGEKPGGGFGAYLAIQEKGKETEPFRLVQFTKVDLPKNINELGGIQTKLSDKPFVFK